MSVDTISGILSESVKSDLPPCLYQLLERTFKASDASLSNGEEHLTLIEPQQKRFKAFSDKNCDGILPGISRHDVQHYPMIGLAIEKVLAVVRHAFVGESKDSDCDHSKGNGDIESALSELSCLHTYIWEQLNIGHWKSVPPLWRKLYTCISLLKVCLLILRHSSLCDIVRECDMGLLMGEPICNNVLVDIAEAIGSKILSSRSDENFAKETNGTGSKDLMVKNILSDENVQTFTIRNKSSNEFQVEESFKPSLESFLSYLNLESPVLLQGIIDHWPAVEKWNVEYIRKVAGFRTVPVEIGQKYTSEDWTQKLMTLNEFINEYMSSSDSISQSGGSKKIGYVAQHNLFQQLPVLRKDIRIPDYCLMGKDEDVEINAWFGPANTVSPTHHDPKHNIFVQVFGSKIIRLFPPSESTKLKPFNEKSLLFNTSQLDVEERGIFKEHPELANIKHCDVILKPGQALFIPKQWWHYVKSLSPSFSVSFWFE